MLSIRELVDEKVLFLIVPRSLLRLLYPLSATSAYVTMSWNVEVTTKLTVYRVVSDTMRMKGVETLEVDI